MEAYKKEMNMQSYKEHLRDEMTYRETTIAGPGKSSASDPGIFGNEDQSVGEKGSQTMEQGVVSANESVGDVALVGGG